ncbi:hypothetical protein AAFF_G00148090 [Aldrovandia affinis]|uniref:Uncharacterized protein n=1 Tax=Aldrovandia affinis TaxID=143900 RepID=A0AAD7W933_9TELE|nr:hypothetical protein AAFF_G00148090 [Aldrovandia affinis]
MIQDHILHLPNPISTPVSCPGHLSFARAPALPGPGAYYLTTKQETQSLEGPMQSSWQKAPQPWHMIMALSTAGALEGHLLHSIFGEGLDAERHALPPAAQRQLQHAVCNVP